MSSSRLSYIIILVPVIMLFSCKSNAPLKVVESVDLMRYTGTWYEIAKIPNSFEKGLKCITANYELRDDGKITVTNRGHKIEEPQAIKTAKGTAKIPDVNIPAKLKVTFFWPFYGKYWIIALDDDYQYALVGDPSRKYLWILARQNKLDEILYNKLIEIAAESGFDVALMEKTIHDCE